MARHAARWRARKPLLTSGVYAHHDICGICVLIKSGERVTARFHVKNCRHATKADEFRIFFLAREGFGAKTAVNYVTRLICDRCRSPNESERWNLFVCEIISIEDERICLNPFVTGDSSMCSREDRQRPTSPEKYNNKIDVQNNLNPIVYNPIYNTIHSILCRAAIVAY